MDFCQNTTLLLANGQNRLPYDSSESQPELSSELTKAMEIAGFVLNHELPTKPLGPSIVMDVIAVAESQKTELDLPFDYAIDDSASGWHYSLT
jgi:hypothetical protein